MGATICHDMPLHESPGEMATNRWSSREGSLETSREREVGLVDLIRSGMYVMYVPMTTKFYVREALGF